MKKPAFANKMKTSVEENPFFDNFAQQAVQIQLEILPELEEYIRPHQTHELEQLEENIRKEGVRDPLVVWKHEGRDILIDGHHRNKVIQKLKSEGEEISFKTTIMALPNLEAVKAWMINNQLGRRNLTDIQRAVLIEQKYALIKSGRGGDRKSDKIKGQNLAIDQKPKNAYQKLSEETGRSVATVKNDIQVAKGLKKLPKEEQVRIATGEKKVKKSDLAELGKKKDLESVQSIDEIKSQNLAIDSSTQKKQLAKSNMIKELRTLLTKIDKEESPDAELIRYFEQRSSALVKELKQK